jgi:hypothetical protein
MMGARDGVEEVQVGGFVSSDKPAVAAGAQEGPAAGEREGDPQHGTGGTAVERDGARAEAEAAAGLTWGWPRRWNEDEEPAEGGVRMIGWRMHAGSRNVRKSKAALCGQPLSPRHDLRRVRTRGGPPQPAPLACVSRIKAHQLLRTKPGGVSPNSRVVSSLQR